MLKKETMLLENNGLVRSQMGHGREEFWITAAPVHPVIRYRELGTETRYGARALTNRDILSLLPSIRRTG